MTPDPSFDWKLCTYCGHWGHSPRCPMTPDPSEEDDMDDDQRALQELNEERRANAVRIVHECSHFLNAEDVEFLCFECGIHLKDIEHAEAKRLAELKRIPERPVADVWK